jgi:hypothetical protein
MEGRDKNHMFEFVSEGAMQICALDILFFRATCRLFRLKMSDLENTPKIKKTFELIAMSRAGKKS